MIAAGAYEPRFPEGYRPAVGIIGAGGIVREAHLPTYLKYEVPIAGIFDPSGDAIRQTIERFGPLRVYSSVEELISDPAVEFVDVATQPEDRPQAVISALRAGKHVLAQKPFSRTVAELRAVLDVAASGPAVVAVNQNARWAPPWRATSLLIEQGAIGDVRSITYLQNTNFQRIVGTVFDRDPHFTIFDFSMHWFDITRCWMADTPIQHVRASTFRTPGQPEGGTAWGMWAEIAYENGVCAMIRGIGGAEPPNTTHPFWVHGSLGTIRGSVRGQEHLVLELGDESHRVPLVGGWYYDGFAGALGELLSAIVERREPHHSLRHNLLSLQMTLAACQSAERDGAPVPVPPDAGP